MNDTTTIAPTREREATRTTANGTGDPLILKGSSYTLTSIRFATTELAAISTFLATKVDQAPAFFKDAPVVIDLEEVSRRPLDLPGLLKVLRSHGMVPMGIRGGSDKTQAEARDIGLARLQGSPAKYSEPAHMPADEAVVAQPSKPAAEPASAPAPEKPTAPDAAPPPPPAALQSKFVTTPVRGGQQLYAAGTDLVLTAGVNQGAEVLADGHVHVYGPLRGRALAGARGNRDARIFTTCLEAELLSIAGTYRVIDDSLPEGLRGKPAQVYLDGDSLKIEPLG
jgi:septum site-determining protein MinC